MPPVTIRGQRAWSTGPTDDAISSHSNTASDQELKQGDDGIIDTATKGAPPTKSLGFCTTGSPGSEHYQLQLLQTYEDPTRWVLPVWMYLCQMLNWFMVVGQRQSGKSSSCRELRDALNATKIDGRSEYLAMLVDLKKQMSRVSSWPVEVLRDDLWRELWPFVDEALMRALAEEAERRTPQLRSSFDVMKARDEALAEEDKSRFSKFLELWATHLRDHEHGRKLVLIIDEYDEIKKAALTQFLNTLRAAHEAGKRTKTRPTASSVILVGLRGYTVEDSAEHSSPYNINAEIFFPPMFGLKQIRELYLQHTEAAGQEFEEGVFEEVLEWTGGAALARE